MEKLRGYSDEELVGLLQKGNGKAFEILYEHYWPILYSQALRMLQDEDDAQDVVQELFIRLYTNSVSLKPDTKLSTFLYVSLRNRIINHIQKGKIRSQYIESLASYAEPAHNATIEAIHEREMRDMMEAEVERMPAKMRQVFELSRNEQLSHKEISKRLDIQESTVKTHINNALKIIRGKMKGMAHFFFLYF